MSRYTGPRWKQSRRLGLSLSGTGKELARRPYAPGDHGANNRRKISEYGQQVREKQKLRWMYGLNERQFQNLFLRAGKIKEGTHGDNFMILLETRLDNLVFRLGLASSRPQARQLVNHGHIKVQPGQVIGLRERSQNLAVVNEAIENTVSRPAYVTFDDNKKEGSLVRLPERGELEPEVDESLVVEYYNQKL